MKPYIALVALFLAVPGMAYDFNSKGQPFDDRPAWTYNVDFRDPEMCGPFVARELNDGQYKGGVVCSPLRIYRVSDGWATPWFHAGGALLTNAEKLNATFTPTFGVDIMRWTSQPSITGPLSLASKIWKPFGLSSVALTLDGFAGWTPVHTSDVHSFAYGGGIKLIGKVGQSNAQIANDAIRCKAISPITNLCTDGGL